MRKSFCNTSLALEVSIGATGRATILAGLLVIINEQWYGFDRTFGWAETAAGGVETYAIRGDHISYMLEHVPLVADQLRACLEKVM